MTITRHFPKADVIHLMLIDFHKNMLDFVNYTELDFFSGAEPDKIPRDSLSGSDPTLGFTALVYIWREIPLGKPLEVSLGSQPWLRASYAGRVRVKSCRPLIGLGAGENLTEDHSQLPLGPVQF